MNFFRIVPLYSALASTDTTLMFKEKALVNEVTYTAETIHHVENMTHRRIMRTDSLVDCKPQSAFVVQPI